MIFIDCQPFHKMQKRSDVPPLPVKIEVRPFVLRGKALARCDLEQLRKLIKIDPKASKIASWGHSGALFGSESPEFPEFPESPDASRVPESPDYPEIPESPESLGFPS